MADISIRELDDEVVRRLRTRAARERVSVEELVRRILRDATRPSANIADLAAKYFGPEHGVELHISRRDPPEPPDFGQ